MKLTYHLYPEDLVVFNEFHSIHSSPVRRKQMRERITVPIVYLILACALFAYRFYLIGCGFVLFAAAWYVVWPWWVRRRYRKHYEKYVADNTGESLRDPITVELEDDKLRATSYIGQSEIKYHALGEILRDGARTYIYIGKTAALILPDDRLGREQIEAFIAEINLRRGK